MNQPSKKKTIVIGAGGGGIASALLAASRGEDVLLLESHYALGGCASYFKRGHFVFDAGATTLSGVNVGEPLGDLFELLGRAPELHPSDPGIVFHLSSGKVISYYRDFEKWMHELETHFPGLPHRPFWHLIRKINSKSWSLLKDVRTFPFRSLSDLKDVIRHPEYVTLVPHLLISTDAALKHFELDTWEYQELVNGILIISAQAEARHIPFLVGAMALSYPSETYAPIGGMKGLMDFFQSELEAKNVKIRIKSRVTNISPNEVTLSSGEKLIADRIISNLPVWNMAQISEGPLGHSLKKEAHKRPGSWGAFTMYFGVKEFSADCYHQVHLNHPLVKNYFVSCSVPNDLKRAPSGYQSVSVSTHVYAESDINRDHLADIIIADFKKRFGAEDIKFLTTGTPKTFERYTGRQNGFVGGLPFLYGKNPLSLLSPLTKDTSVFRVGDTVFPGQGLCGVVAGALQLHHRLK